MAGDKKYYWLKLQRDFFKRHDIRIIEEMENGKDYLLFYLKLLVESIDHEGSLRFSDTVPYNDKMLSIVTNTNVDIVRSALKVFEQLNMIEVLEDETIYMTEVEKMIGTSSQDEHTKESTRLRVQAFRERQKQAQIEQKRYSNVTCNGELEKEIEKDIEIEKDNISSLRSDICAEPSKTTTPQEPVFIKMPLADKTDFDVTESMVAEYRELYPSVDIEQALRNMRGWCLDNPTRKKTRTGVRRFIGNWLAKEQDRGGNRKYQSQQESDADWLARKEREQNDRK